MNPPDGCKFWPRSPVEHDERLRTKEPEFKELVPGHWVSNCPYCVSETGAG